MPTNEEPTHTTGDATPGEEPSPEQGPAAKEGALRTRSALSRWGGTFSSLRNRDFRFLWLGMLVLMAGVEMEMVAIGYLTYDLTGSALLLGVVEAGFAIPTLALGLLGGVVADRIDRKLVIQISQTIEGLVALAIAILILTDNIDWTHLVIMAVIEGSLFSFMMPARQAIVPQLVQPSQLTNAIAINSAGFSSMILVAPAVAGGLYAIIGPGGVFIVVTVLKAISVLLTSWVRRVRPERAEENHSVVRDIKDGLSYVVRTRVLLVLLVFGLASNLVSWPFHTLIPVFVVDIYHLGPEAMGLMLSVLGGGSLIGSLAIASIGRWHRGLLLIAGGVVTALGLFLVAAIPVYYAAVGFMVILGLGEATWWTITMTLTMEQSEDKYRGRVSSVYMMNMGLMPLGILPAGIATEYLGGQITVAILASLLMITTLIFFVTQKQIRRLQ